MLSGGRNQKTGEQLDTSVPAPALKFYPHSGSPRVVEEPAYNLERVVNNTHTVTCWASKTKACIVYPSWGDLSSRCLTVWCVHGTKLQYTKSYPFDICDDDTTINQFDEEETSSKHNA